MEDIAKTSELFDLIKDTEDELKILLKLAKHQRDVQANMCGEAAADGRKARNTTDDLAEKTKSANKRGEQTNVCGEAAGDDGEAENGANGRAGKTPLANKRDVQVNVRGEGAGDDCDAGNIVDDLEEKIDLANKIREAVSCTLLGGGASTSRAIRAR